MGHHFKIKLESWNFQDLLIFMQLIAGSFCGMIGFITTLYHGARATEHGARSHGATEQGPGQERAHTRDNVLIITKTWRDPSGEVIKAMWFSNPLTPSLGEIETNAHTHPLWSLYKTTVRQQPSVASALFQGKHWPSNSHYPPSFLAGRTYSPPVSLTTTILMFQTNIIVL